MTQKIQTIETAKTTSMLQVKDQNSSIEETQVRHPDFRAVEVQVLLFLLSLLLPAFADDMQVNGPSADLEKYTFFFIFYQTIVTFCTIVFVLCKIQIYLFVLFSLS